jgi:uncharacterized protein
MLVILSVHLKISGHYPDGRSAWLKMGLPDGYDRDGRNELLNAIFRKDVDSSIELIESGNFDLDERDNNGYSPLHAAAQYQLVSVVDRLLLGGASVNSLDEWGNPPIQRALGSKPENALIISKLLEAGADIHIQNKSGNSVATHVGKLKSHPNYEQLQSYL